GHASEELAEIADRILLIAEGRILADGPPQAGFSETTMLGAHKVRPPDIARSFEVLAHFLAGASRPEKLPVTIAAAMAAYVDHPLPVPSAPAAPAMTASSKPPGTAALSAEGL